MEFIEGLPFSDAEGGQADQVHSHFIPMSHPYTAAKKGFIEL